MNEAVMRSKVASKLREIDDNFNTLEGHINTLYGMLAPFMKPATGGGVSGSMFGTDDAKDGIIYRDLMNKNLKVVMMSIRAKEIVERVEL